MCSHEVPQVVPQVVPNSLVCPKFNSHVNKLKKVAHFCFYFLQLGGSKRCFYLGVSNVPNLFFFGDGANQHGPFQKEKKGKKGQKKKKVCMHP